MYFKLLRGAHAFPSQSCLTEGNLTRHSVDLILDKETRLMIRLIHSRTLIIYN